jgi:anaerobic selenocysteine-containing dehydrogenase
VKVLGASEHPTTHGALCRKVSRYTERTYHPDRLLYPKRRTGAKGSGRFERISWEEAIAEIAEKLKAIAEVDPQGIVPYSYAGTMGQVQGEGMAMRFFHRLGASFLDRTICAAAGTEALNLTLGHRMGMRVENFERSALIIIWGSNSITSNLHFWTYATRAKRNGARLICIDPRRTETAEKCDQHLAIRPGTDAALALALIRELVVNQWLDEDFVAQHTEGFDALRQEAMQWTPERTAVECGITSEEVCSLAGTYATTKPAAIRLNYGMQRVRGGGNAVRLIASLPALVGAWRDPAGGMLLSSSGFFPKNPNFHRPELLAGRTPRTINMSTIGNDLLRSTSAEFGPRIDALIVYNSNPVAVAPDSAQVVRGFSRPDLFCVVLEQFQTDTADFADIVLPATTQLEHWDVHASYGHTSVILNEPAIEPLGESRPNSEIFRQLARAMGYDDACFAQSDQLMIDEAFTRERGDLSFAQLKEKHWIQLDVPDAPFAGGQFPTPSGRCRFANAEISVATYLPPYESREFAPELAKRFPLAMISPPARNFLNSTFVNVASLRDIEGEPILEIHPDDAASRKIEDRAIVRIFNDRGATLARAHISTRARQGVVHGLSIWWRKFGLDGTNVNQLTHQQLTDLGRAPSFYDCLVEVEVADDAVR